MISSGDTNSDSHDSRGEKDSGVLTNPLQNDARDVSSGLRRCAFKATHRLAASAPGELAPAICALLRDLCRRLSAVDVHLFRVLQKEDGTGSVGMRYQSGFNATDADLAVLHQFPYELLSEKIRKCFRGDDIVRIRKGSNSGGRMVTGLMKHLKCEFYLLCPIKIDGNLRGVLGVAGGSTDEFTRDPQPLELIQLIGAILLNHIIRVRRENARRRKLRKWRGIADQACDFALSIDERGVIFATTPFGSGDDTPDLNGLRLDDIVNRSFHREIKTQIDRAAETTTVRTCDFQLQLGADGARWYLARIEPHATGPGGRVTLYLTDHSPDKELKEQNRELTEQLDRASRLSLLGQMSTEFAHQLNQPLQAILNYCNTMQRRIRKGTATEENMQKALSNIETSVLHSGDIIQRIRDFVRFRSLRVEETDLSLIIDQAAMMVLPTIQGKNAELITPTGISAISVNVDRAQTTHVLVNLMINALEACCDANISHPRIDVSVLTDAPQGQVVISVRDNGPGLPKDDPGVVFRKFYTGKKEGLGMGLTISRDVCESQGGHLTAANNADGTGSMFSVVLPMAGFQGADTAELEIVTHTVPLID